MAEEGEGHAGDGDQPHVPARDHPGLHAEQCGDATGEQRFETRFSALRDAQSAVGDGGDQHDHAERADEAELLG